MKVDQTHKLSKRIFGVIISLITAIMLALAVYIAVGAFVSKSQGKPFDYFGVSVHIVASNSMSPEYEVGEIVFVRQVDIATVEIGQDVLFWRENAVNGIKLTLHRVVNKEINGDKVLLTTKGIKEGAIEDEQKVEQILGVATFKSEFLGGIYLMLTTPMGWVSIILTIGGIAVATKCVFNIVKGCKKSKTDEDVKDSENEETEDNQGIGDSKNPNNDKDVEEPYNDESKGDIEDRANSTMNKNSNGSSDSEQSENCEVKEYHDSSGRGENIANSETDEHNR